MPPSRSTRLPLSTRLGLETLEHRLVLTSTLFLDFGNSFPAGGLTIGVDELRDTIRGPNLNGRGGLTDADDLSFRPLAGLVTFDFNGDSLVNAADVTDLQQATLDIVRRHYEPFDLDIVINNASSLADINAAMAANAGSAGGQFDAYVLVCNVVDAANMSVGGRTGLFGIASDLDIGGNNARDESVAVFAENFLGGFVNTAASALAMIASHEGGHTLSLRHTVGAAGGADANLLGSSDIIQEGGGDITRLTRPDNVNTRFDLQRGDGNTDTGVTENSYTALATDPDIGLRAGGPDYITGTGAHDRIEITPLIGPVALVSVNAFRTAGMAGGDLLGTNGYLAVTPNGLVVEAANSDDLIRYDATVGANVDARGGTGTDTLEVLNAALTYTPPASGDSSAGTLTAGGNTIRFREMEFVRNVAPAITNVSVPSLTNEDNFIVLSGSFIDAGSLATHVVTIDWGDGTVNTINLATGVRTFSRGHTYADDGASPGNGTPQDVYTIRITITDNDNLVAVSQPTITVMNVVPIVLLDSIPAIDEADFVTLTGSFTDQGFSDLHDIVIDWDDPNNAANSTFALPATNDLNPGDSFVSTTDTGVLTITSIDLSTIFFRVGHQYRDDGLAPGNNTDQDISAIAVTVSDDDAGTETTTTSVVVRNVAPTVALNGVSAIAENGTAVLTGTFTDPGLLDPHQVVVDWDDPNDGADSTFAVGLAGGLGVGTTIASSTDGAVLTITSVSGGTIGFSVSHQYLDDGPAPGNNTAADTSTVSVTVTDDDTGSGNQTATVLVNNVAPVITATDTSSPSGDKAREGETVAVSGTFSDVGPLDLHTVTLDWGDGTLTSATVNQLADTFAGGHAYAAGGIYTVTITLSDDDTLVATAIETVFITGAGVQEIDGQTVLFVIGSDVADQVTMNQSGNDTIVVHASFLPDQGRQRSFGVAGLDQIRVILCSGDDQATVAGNVRIPALLDGRAGNDRLNAGGVGSVLLGGPGDDMLIGSPGRDILLGGDGRDRLVGNGGEDILIGGLTTYDFVPDDNKLANDAALFSVRAEWNSSRSLEERMANVTGTPNPSFGARLNGNNYLQLGITVTDDGDEDVMTGSAGRDWFFAFAGDILTDLNGGDELEN